ncbi:MAG: hypothetical protein OWS74_06565 [Firmicutes bacterium]|nr:hypothetical protein [Bacillota bacterium]
MNTVEPIRDKRQIDGSAKFWPRKTCGMRRLALELIRAGSILVGSSEIGYGVKSIYAMNDMPVRTAV